MSLLEMMDCVTVMQKNWTPQRIFTKKSKKEENITISIDIWLFSLTQLFWKVGSQFGWKLFPSICRSFFRAYALCNKVTKRPTYSKGANVEERIIATS